MRQLDANSLRAIVVTPGAYDIGHSSIPNASPHHRRRLPTSVWIDATPVTWRLFEIFVCAGGFYRTDLWPDGVDPANVRPSSVDRRHRELLEKADEFRGTLTEWPGEHPVTGLTWFEAFAVTRFFGARLPFEVEWEVAIGNQLPERGAIVPTLGVMREWTQDAFAAAYYRADFARRGVPWNPRASGTLVSVRGSAPSDLFQHVATRTGRDPGESDGYCGFRRAWDSQPTSDQLSPPWP